eukprot:COSAG01_NODE_1064_length_11885_cov_7.744358_1_plen_76_part_00
MKNLINTEMNTPIHYLYTELCSISVRSHSPRCTVPCEMRCTVPKYTPRISQHFTYAITDVIGEIISAAAGAFPGD